MTLLNQYGCNLCGSTIAKLASGGFEGVGLDFREGRLVEASHDECKRHLCGTCVKNLFDYMTTYNKGRYTIDHTRIAGEHIVKGAVVKLGKDGLIYAIGSGVEPK